MDTDTALARIARDGRDIIAAGRRQPDVVVPQYPTWTLRDLVAHVAFVHGRTAAICRTLPSMRIEGPTAPADGDLFEWAADVLEDMLAALASADLDAETWTFVPDKRLRTWLRRMVIETGLHRWDAGTAEGSPAPLSEMVALAGLDEFADNYLPRLGDVPPIELVDPGLGRSWRYGAGRPEAVIEGTASDHYLRLMSRPGTALPSAWEAAVDALGSPADT